MVCGGLPAVFLLFLQRFVLIHGSTLIREDTPGSEMSVMEFGYDPHSIKGNVCNRHIQPLRVPIYKQNRK